MSIISKSSVKSTFETGDKPTQAEFADFIDSSMRDSMVAIATAAEGGKTGLIEILASAEVTAIGVSGVGRDILFATAASSVRTLISAQADLLGVMTTDGDLLTREAGVLSVISIGTAQTIFESDGSAAAWVDRVGSLTEETTVDVSADDLAFFDDDAGVSRKIPVRTMLAESLQLQTAVSAASTEVDFTGLPSTAKRLTVILNGVSTNGTNPVRVQLGDSGGIEATGYSGSRGDLDTAPNFNQITDGFVIKDTWAASEVAHGHVTITLLTGNIWVASGLVALSNVGEGGMVAGSKTLSGTLTQVRITADGVDTFDTGTINILVE